MGDGYTDRATANMISEARAHVYDGKELAQRFNATPEMLTRRESYVKDFIKEWEAEFGRPWSFGSPSHKVKPWTDAQRKSIQERLLNRVHSMGQHLERTPEEMEQWLDEVNNLYQIGDNNDEVISYANEDRRPNGQPQVWQVADESQAEDKIVTLLGNKIVDRRRGRGDVDRDLGNTQSLQ